LPSPKSNKFVNRIDKNAKFIKVDRQAMSDYVASHFKATDCGRAFFTLSCKVAVRSGFAKYTKYTNFVPEGSWVGGVVGLKSILSDTQNKLSSKDIDVLLEEVKNKGYIVFYKQGKKYEVRLAKQCFGDELVLSPNPPEKTVGKNGSRYYNKPVPIERWNSEFFQEGYIKNYNNALSENDYDIRWTSGFETDLSPEENNRVYNYSNEGWLPLAKAFFDNRASVYQDKKNKRNHIVKTKHQAERFSPCEAFLDLYSHTVFRDYNNFFSWFCPAVMFENKSLLTCRGLAERWGWGKSEVHRFLKEHNEVFECVVLPGNCGTVLFNKMVKGYFLVPSKDSLSGYLKEVVGEGRISKEYANDYVSKFSFLFIRKYFCVGVFCPKGTALREFISFCRGKDIVITEPSRFVPVSLDVLCAAKVPKEWKMFFSSGVGWGCEPLF